MLKAVFLCFVVACCVLGEEVCKKGEKKILQKKPKIVMRCNGKGEWKQEKQRAAPGGPPCTDSPAMNNTCPAERGHCLQFTQIGAKMDGDCPGTCDSCDGCRCQDNHQWHMYCPYWQYYCDSAGVLGNWMTTNCRKTCGKCQCKCCSYDGEQHALGAIIQLPEKCGQLQCVEGLVAPASPMLTGAAVHTVSHPEELTLTFVSVHDGYDCCILPYTAGRGEKNGTMVPEGWSGQLSKNGNKLQATCCHGILGVPLNDAIKFKPEQSGCPTGWSIFQSKCYRVYSSARNWTTAQEECKKEGANLASITESAINNFVSNLANGEDSLNIGGYEPTTNTYVWIDGSPWAYTNWDLGEPRGNPEHCVVLRISSEKWHDYGCDQVTDFAYVCNYSI